MIRLFSRLRALTLRGINKHPGAIAPGCFVVKPLKS